MIIYILFILSYGITGWAKACNDKIRFYESNETSTNPNSPVNTWENKYIYTNPIKHFLFSTILVFASDYFHKRETYRWLPTLIISSLLIAVFFHNWKYGLGIGTISSIAYITAFTLTFTKSKK